MTVFCKIHTKIERCKATKFQRKAQDVLRSHTLCMLPQPTSHFSSKFHSPINALGGDGISIYHSPFMVQLLSFYDIAEPQTILSIHLVLWL